MSVSTLPEKDLFNRLNPQQIEAVSQSWGPSLVIAGAGSGKTTVLTRRIAYLMSKLNQDPESILAVTFTNKAAQEMKLRIETLVGYELARRLTIGTFHSICTRLLRQEIEQYRTEEGWLWGRNFVIYDETDSLNVLKAQITKLNLDEKVFVAKSIKRTISAIKNDGSSAGRYASSAKTYREIRIAEIFSNYQSELARNNALDFDDLILVFNDLLRSNSDVLARQHKGYRNILVDEFQDTNQAQYDLINMLATGNSNRRLAASSEHDWRERSLLVVGDVDQSIYSWRQADFRIILGFQNDFKECRLIKLEENYRSTNTILEVANSIITNNSERIEKVLRCNRGQGAKVQCFEAADEIDEAYYVVEELKRLQSRGKSFSDCVILYRTNAQSRAIEEILVRNHIAYVVLGATRFYDRQEIKDVLAYLKLISNEQDGQAFNRIVNVPRRGLGKTTIERLLLFAEQNRMTAVQAALRADSIKDISAKQAKSLMDFAQSVMRWQSMSQVTPVSALLDMVLKETGYLKELEAESKNDDLAIGRVDNVRELMAVAKEFEAIADEPDLSSFLTRISLVSDLDAANLEQDAVKMMTLHLAKGLEFPIVFLTGLEEGLFPHFRSLDSPAAMEEERRLLYVGITRAADLLYMTFARKRMLLGRRPGASGSFSANYAIPSRFLKEIKPGLLTGYYQKSADPAISSEDANSDSLVSWPRSSRTMAKDKDVDNSFRSSFNRSGSTNSHTSSRPIQMSGTAHGAESKEPFEHLKVGDIVQHTKFGIGQITQIIGEQDKELYNVDFKTAGKRLLDPRFAKLIRISEG